MSRPPSDSARPPQPDRARFAPLLPWCRARGERPVWGLAVLLPLLALLPGCTTARITPRQTLHVVVVPTERLDWMRSDLIQDGRLVEPLLNAFRRLEPDVDVQISLQSQSGLQERLRVSSSQGLAPDLLMVRAPQAVALMREGLVDALPRRDPAITRVLGRIRPLDLDRVVTAEGIAGLPVFSEFTLACYDRSRLPQPPATLAELLQLAASGRTVGLSVDPIGLWWTAGALGAGDVMAPILVGSAASLSPSKGQQLQQLETWLSWLRQAALQSRVEIESGPQSLTEGLESGRLSWIPCFSITLVRLDRSMGTRLGVAPLPEGPAGMPTPFSTSRVWALGPDSSPEQRRLALKLASISLDPLIQRQLMMSSFTLLPANRFVPIPVSSSGRLGALAVAKEQFERASPLLGKPFSIGRLESILPAIESALMDVMVGVSTPRQGAEALLRLRPMTAGGH
jgi:arabinogalactan oligomer/maltooligosaccharide transport system substrate-binding protein